MQSNVAHGGVYYYYLLLFCRTQCYVYWLLLVSSSTWGIGLSGDSYASKDGVLGCLYVLHTWC